MNNFTIQKNNFKEKENQPDYNMNVKEEEKWVTIGGCWLKEAKNGNKYFSCQLNKPYQDKQGYVINTTGSEKPQNAPQDDFDQDLTQEPF